METYLVYADAINNSNKFWSAKVEGNNVLVQWGRVGYKAQTKTHNFTNPQQAISKYNSLVSEKEAKGYEESRPQVDSCSVRDIRKAIRTLNNLRTYVATANLSREYFQMLNQYLKIIPTPLGMQIVPSRIYRNAEDVDHQIRLLTSLLPTEQPQQTKDDVGEEKVVSLKSISKNFWRCV